MRTLAPCVVTAALVIAGFVPVAAADQKTGPVVPPLVSESMYGPDLFRHYCATCHGRDGKGKGPAAEALKVTPPDLTTLARRRNGVFPAADVEAMIAGTKPVAAHGSGEMPVWGPIFRALDPSDARAKARISALTSHINAIQQK